MYHGMSKLSLSYIANSNIIKNVCILIVPIVKYAQYVCPLETIHLLINKHNAFFINIHVYIKGLLFQFFADQHQFLVHCFAWRGHLWHWSVSTNHNRRNLQKVFGQEGYLLHQVVLVE